MRRIRPSPPAPGRRQHPGVRGAPMFHATSPPGTRPSSCVPSTMSGAFRLALLLAFVPGFSSPAASAVNPARRPNILLALGDNWAWPHAGALGDPVVRTPVFDRVAREGALPSRVLPRAVVLAHALVDPDRACGASARGCREPLERVPLRMHQAKASAAAARTLEVEMCALRIGDFKLVTFPGELTVEIGLNIKKAVHDPHAFVAGYTNGYIYYTPTVEQRTNTGY